MKKLLPIMLLVPCVAMGANTHSNALKAQATKAIYRNVANAGPVSGTVKDETGAPLPGVSVSIKGTTNGTQTDVNGKFKLSANPGDVLVFTYVGYLRKEVTVGNNTNYEVSLTTDAKSINEVVVTALGIKRSEASISYDQQTVGGKELEVAKDPSFVNSLQGKVSGLQIQQSSSGAGGSTKVVLRGDRSINNSNNVLYVVDGIPLNPVTSGQPTGIFSGNADGGDGISNINPDDIESISVLKGASAAALYGSQGANGVVLITTKKGQAGKTSVTLNSITSFDNAVKVPKMQTEYGEGSGGTNVANSVDSWGAKESGSQPNGQASQYFITGDNYINSFTLSTGNDKNQTFVSYANTDATGIQPGNKFVRNNISFTNSSKLFNDKLTLDISASYISQDRKDAPTSGSYFNALSSVYLFPRGLDFEKYKTYETFDASRNIMLDNWFQPVNSNADYFENPYWVQYRNPTDQGLNRILGSITAKYDINSWLYIQGRIKVDATDQTASQDIYAGSNLLFSSASGHYNYSSTQQDQVYSDLILNVNKDLSPDFNINGSAGAVIQDNQASSTGFNANLGNIDNFFNVSNLSLAAGNPFSQSNKNENQTQSLFAAVDFGYKKYLFLDVTARNEWNSALAYALQSNFFYPSVGLSGVLSNMVKMPDAISYAKVRLSYADVGNSIPVNTASPAQYTLSSGLLNLNQTQPLAGLKPEKTHSFEVGTEWRFFNDHLSFDATYYHTNSYNQFFTVKVSQAGSGGYSSEYINGGNVQNQGIEGSLGYNGKLGSAVQWNSTVTFSLNKSKVVALYNDPVNGPQNVFVFPNNFDSYETEARVGHPFGEIYAADFVRDAQGNPVLTGGKPTIQTDANTFKDVGNENPNFMMGWTNSFKVQNFDLAFTIDGRFGGKAVDMTQAYMDAYGTSVASADARDKGGVVINGTTVDAQTYYQTVGSRQGALAQYVYSATNVRLREASLGYTLPFSTGALKSIRFALTGRNLLFFYLKAPFDPETILSTDNTLGGLGLFQQPSVRTIGFNVSAKF